MRRIILDCTHTFQTGAGTGIQRLVRQFADSLLAIAHSSGVEVIPVRVERDQLIPLPVSGGRVAFPRSESAREAIAAPDPRLLRLRSLGHRLNIVGSRRFLDWLEAGPNEPGLLRKLERRRPQAAVEGALRLGPDDALLSLDSSWAYGIRDALDAAGRAGATRVAVLCDVFPMTQPEWFMEGTRRQFEGWLRMLLPRLDAIVAISRATCDELRSVVDSGRLGALRPPRCTAVHLGAEIGAEDDSRVRAVVRDAFAGTAPAFLTVGTLEPRKNADFALDLFDALLARGLDIHWHIAGADGWYADHTVRRIHSHPELGARLFRWTDLDDAEMSWCYRHAAALVATSKAEGFGLPAVEARLHGTPVFAADIPVFREILGDEARYLPLSSAALAAAALEDFVCRTLPAGPGRTVSRVARTWQAAARELLETVARIDRERRAA